MGDRKDLEQPMISASNRWTDNQDKVRQKLRDYRSLVSKYMACSELYNSLYPRVTTKLKPDRIQGQSDVFELETIVQQRMDMSDQMQRSLDAMSNEIGEIMGMIESLPPDEYTIILRRYTLAESMETVSEKTFISIRQCWEYHRRAIIRLAERCSDLQ